jgi:hypothetical protein
MPPYAATAALKLIASKGGSLEKALALARLAQKRKVAATIGPFK